MRNRWELFLLIAVAIVVLGTGCAIGNKHRYHDAVADFETSGTIPVAVGTHDQRDYIVDGGKGTTYVGTQRSGVGIPYNVSTASGKPLADDMTRSVCASLKKKGFDSSPVIIDYSLDSGAAVRELIAASPERAVLLVLHEWKSETYQNTSLHYKVELKVFNAEGTELAEAKIEGEDDLKGSAWNPPSHAKKAVPIAFKEKLEALFNQPQIVEALQGD